MDVHASACIAGSAWIVARTKPRQETYAFDNVARQGFESYLPKCIDNQTHKVAVLFPGYLFVREVMQWSWLKSTYGILDLVYGSVGAPAKLSDKVVEEIKQREGDNGLVALPLERFRRGQRVRLLGGPFFGMLGLYEGLSARSRVTVLLSLLGALTPVTVPERLVEVA